jgi:uncharacterized membrane protein
MDKINNGAAREAVQVSDNQAFKDKLAGSLLHLAGYWRFIIIQTVVVAVWMTLSSMAFIQHWNIHLFFLLNLLFSIQAVYAAPMMMINSKRRQGSARTENEKLDKIIELLNKLPK